MTHKNTSTGGWDRTSDLFLMKEALSRLSYAGKNQSPRQDSNLYPPAPEAGALPSCATRRTHPRKETRGAERFAARRIPNLFPASRSS